MTLRDKVRYRVANLHRTPFKPMRSQHPFGADGRLHKVGERNRIWRYYRCLNLGRGQCLARVVQASRSLKRAL